MRGALVILVVAGCDVGGGTTALRLEPASVDVTVELGVTTPISLRLFAGDVDVTDGAAFALTGAPLGVLDGGTVTSDGRIGGRAQVAATYDGETTLAPLRVVLHGSRNETVGTAPAWFAAAAATPIDAQLEPGDGAVLPPNLVRLTVELAVPAGDDLHEVAITSTELDLHVYGQDTAMARSIALTPLEWEAIARTSRGEHVDLVVRGLASLAPSTMHVASAHLAIADLPFASEILFTGKRMADTTAVAQVWSYQLARGTTDAWANGPSGGCLGCHLALSRDGKKLAANGAMLVDTQTRYVTAPASAAIGSWTAAAFGPAGELVTANAGALVVRDGTTALPIASLATPVPAAQPAVGARHIAYVGGPIDIATTQPIQQELRIHAWDAATFTFGESRVLVPSAPGALYKLPELSLDDRWVMYAQVPQQMRVMGDIMVIPPDGSAPPVKLAEGFDMARFASPVAAARAGGEAEPMMWIVMKSNRPVGPLAHADPLLWAMAFFPERGVASRPIYLPGQNFEIAVIHAPSAIP